MRGRQFAAGAVLLGAIGVGILFWSEGPVGSSQQAARLLSYEELTGTTFLPPPKDLLRSPRVRELEVPDAPDATSIWGATGRDVRGHIWVGVSARSPGMSAYLFEYDPDADRWHDRGAVADQLKTAGIYRVGEGQIKIHSKIIAAEDGLLYFASTDEEGESADGAVLPRWGGHLWRLHPDSLRWEHLSAVPEGLVAVNGVGRYVYALGYWNHVLYQFDTSTQAIRRTVVGSVAGHVSRNFLVDARGHAYVPRVSTRPDGNVGAQLIEYDTDLQPVAATPLEFYLGRGSVEANHGVVGLAYLSDGRLVFTTHVGQLYVIDPHGSGPAVVKPLGSFHPQGEAYAPSLFSLGGSSLIAGVAQRRNQFDWVVFELSTGIAAAYPFDTKGLEKVLLYGSITRDNLGRAYLVGWASNGAGGQRPLALQIGAAPWPQQHAGKAQPSR